MFEPLKGAFFGKASGSSRCLEADQKPEVRFCRRVAGKRTSRFRPNPLTPASQVRFAPFADVRAGTALPQNRTLRVAHRE